MSTRNREEESEGKEQDGGKDKDRNVIGNEREGGGKEGGRERER